MSKPGFDLQWTSRLENQRRGLQGFTQGVTASGVTLFVPTSIVAGSSNNLFMLDNDTGHMIWSRTFEGRLPASTDPCTGGITAAPTRIVNGIAEPTVPPPAATTPPPAAIQQGYRSALGEPGQGIPVEPRAPRPGGSPAAAGPGRVGPGPGARPQAPRIPGAPDLGGGGTGRAMVAYAIAGDGQLHVVGLQSGKDLQKPAPFLPANAQWSNPVAVGTMMYAATSGNCAGAPNGVYAIDLDAADKPVVSYRTNGGSVVGSVAFSSDGDTLLASIGPGSATAGGKTNAIVALDPRTLALKDWFTQPAAEFVTGPTVFRHGAKDVVAAATKDGRVILLDVASLGGANHATPLMTSQSLVASGGSIAAEALATWARASARGPEERWILVPLSGRIVALRVAEERGGLTLTPEWTSKDLTTPATPIIVNGVVFALSTGRPATGGGRGSPAVLYAYDGVSGEALWSSGKSMATFASPGSYWSALSQVYVGTDDGTVYAFGFLDERR
jgi:outer membrane protein assembly factor BamB